jgi:hypothetical protein
MKTRNGFVSNSSSSSFIVAFKKVPRSIKEMQEMLFGDEPYYKNPYYYPEEEKYGSKPNYFAQEVSMTVYQDMKDPVPVEEIPERLNCGYLVGQGAPDLNDWQGLDGFDKWHKEMEKYAAKAAKSFIENNPDATFYEFEYSDNDGPYKTALEHGDLFRRMPHLKVGHH